MPEKDRSGKRFCLSTDKTLTVTDTQRKEKTEIKVAAAYDAHLVTFLTVMTAIANKRTGDFDALFNSLDALDAVFIFLKKAYPGLLTSGLLQPLTDLLAAVHDCVVGAKPELIYGRRQGLNGGYRWLENYPTEEKLRPMRLYSDMLEALIVLAFEALLAGHDKKKAEELFGTMLESQDIGKVDGKARTGVSIKYVKRWRRSLREVKRKPAKGREYSFQSLFEGFEAELALCVDPVQGLRVAKDLIARVRDHQPTGWFVPDREDLAG